MLKSRREIGNASLANENSDRKRKRAGKKEKVEDALKQWYIKVREKMAELQDHFLFMGLSPIDSFGQ